MSTATPYPYDTRLNILHKHLEVIDEKALSDAAPHKWYNQTLCQVNASVVRVGVVEGKLLIDLEGRTVELTPRQGFVVSKGVLHRTRAPQRTVILMFENAGIIPTGDK